MMIEHRLRGWYYHLRSYPWPSRLLYRLYKCCRSKGTYWD